MKPPCPFEDIPLPDQEREYVAPGVYDDGNPFIVGTIMASLLWQVQPLELLPVFPDEFASTKLMPEMASKRKLTASARIIGDIPFRV